MKLALLLGLSLLVSPFVYAGDVQMKCFGSGRSFTCIGSGMGELDSAPLWIFHKKNQPYRTWGEEFKYQPTPKDWTVLEMRVYPWDQSGAPYNGVVFTQVRTWVRVCKDRTVFYPYHEGIKPPACN